NLRRRPAHNVRICAAVPAGFSLVSAPQARLVEGAPCWTVGVLPAESVAEFAFQLRLNSRVAGTSRARLRLMLTVGTTRAPAAPLGLSVSRGATPPGVPPVTG